MPFLYGQRNKELGGGAAQRRDWRGIGTALLVIFIICLLIFLCGYIFISLGFSDPTPNKHTVNLTELKKFRPANSVPDWLKDARLFYDNDDGTHIMSFENGSSNLVVSYKEIHDLLQRGASVQCSFDCSQVSLSYTAENPGVNPEKNSDLTVPEFADILQLVKEYDDVFSKINTIWAALKLT